MKFKGFFLLSSNNDLLNLQLENLLKGIFFLLFFPPFLLITVNYLEQMWLFQ